MHFKRGNRKLIADYRTKDFYEYYKNKYKDRAVDYAKFVKVWDDFIDLRMQLVVYNNLEFHMPNRFGSIGVNIIGDVIRVRKDGNLRTLPNWGESKKLWETMYPNKSSDEIKLIKDKPIVYYTNDHSSGKYVKIMWDKTSCNFKCHSHYSFKPVRKWSVKVAQFIKKTKALHYYEKFTYVKSKV